MLLTVLLVVLVLALAGVIRSQETNNLAYVLLVVILVLVVLQALGPVNFPRIR